MFRQLGAEIREVSLPLTQHAVPLQLLTADAHVASWSLATYLRDRYERFDVGTRTRTATGALIPAAAYNRAMRARALVRAQVLDALRDADALLCPSNVTAPKPIDAMRETVAAEAAVMPRLVERRISLYPFSLSNVPALSVPCGFSAAGLEVIEAELGEAMNAVDPARIFEGVLRRMWKNGRSGRI